MAISLRVQVCLDRAMKRGQSDGKSARSDDNLESLKKRYASECVHTTCRSSIGWLMYCRV